MVKGEINTYQGVIIILFKGRLILIRGGDLHIVKGAINTYQEGGIFILGDINTYKGRLLFFSGRGGS